MWIHFIIDLQIFKMKLDFKSYLIYWSTNYSLSGSLTLSSGLDSYEAGSGLSWPLTWISPSPELSSSLDSFLVLLSTLSSVLALCFLDFDFFLCFSTFSADFSCFFSSFFCGFSVVVFSSSTSLSELEVDSSFLVFFGVFAGFFFSSLK